MPRTEYLFSSFVGGELSPSLLQARVDLEKYFDGLEVCENFIVRPLGGVIRRPGTRYVATVKDPTRSVRLVPFQFSVSNHHVLEFGHLYIRFYQDGAQIQDGGGPLEIVSPYSETQLSDLRITQSADILFIAHPLHAPRQLQRLAATNWQIIEQPHEDGPYLAENITDNEVTLSTGTATVGATITLTADTALFASTDIGRQFRFLTGTDWFWFTITAFTSDTVVDARVEVELPGGLVLNKATWRLGAWSDTTGYPATVGIAESRIWWGATTEEPQTVWSSSTNNFDDYTPTELDGTVIDTNAITRTLDTDSVNTIRWITGTANGIVVGGDGTEFVVNAGIAGDVVTPANALERPHTTRGSHASANTIKLDHTVLFVEQGGEALNRLEFSFERDGMTVVPLSLLVDHIAEHRFVQQAKQLRPFRVIWLRTTDNKLYGLTYEPEQRVIAWHTHVLGGVFDGGDPVVESITSIYNGTDDELWLAVKRTVNSATVRYIERMTPTFRELDDQEDAMYLDASSTYDSVPATAMTGFDQLEGETVQVIADGAVHADATVSGGAFTLATAASVVHAGFHAPSDFTPVSAELPISSGVSIGNVKRVTDAFINVRRTTGLSIRLSDGTYEPLPMRGVDDAFDTAVPLFSGLLQATPDTGYDREAKIALRCETALPCTVLSLRLNMELNDA